MKHFLLHIIMNRKIIASDEAEIKKHKSHQHKNLMSIYDVDTNKTLVSNKVSFRNKGFQYFMAKKMVKMLDLYA